tara:strand:- start:2091 stop:3362 length:1272 start_codon:yes stop_codon:yes gene_type:complete
MTSLLSNLIQDNVPTIITFVFLIIVSSYYVLLFKKTKKPDKVKTYSSVTVIIPAHNEEKYIRECIESVKGADFEGEKEIIVVDDGSIDKTSEIVSSFEGIKLIKSKHSGKSASLNRALMVATGELVAVVDGDSFIHKHSLQEVVNEVGGDNVAAACCPVRVRNRNKFVCIWLHIGEIYFSLLRHLFSKVNANITTPGPLSVYRKKELMDIGGFSTEGFSEDADVTIRLIREGYKIGYAEHAIAETNMPHDFKGFFRQRTRFARGLINLLKRHMQFNNKTIDYYTMPIFLFGYFQAVFMGSLSIYQITTGYYQYFFSKGIYFNFLVLKFLFEWFSVIGFARWMFSIVTGQSALSALAILGIVSTLLTYPLYIISILKFDKKFDFLHFLAIFFMAPFWLVIMGIHIVCIPEYFAKKQDNIWKKNE